MNMQTMLILAAVHIAHSGNVPQGDQCKGEQKFTYFGVTEATVLL